MSTVVLSQASWDDYPLQIDALFDSLQSSKRQTILNTTGGVCSYYLSSTTCVRGNACPYKHHRTPQNLVCKHYLRGLCKKGDYCEFSHVYDLSRMPTCQFFLAYGECGNPDCNFLHVKSAEVEGECEDYAHGFCQEGVRCEFEHVRGKELCADYLTGFCVKGPQCLNEHPKYEVDGGRERRKKQAKKRADAKQILLVAEGAAIEGEGRGYFTERVTYKHAHAPKPAMSLASITCNSCGEQGHFAAQCPQKGGGGGGEGGRGGRRMEEVQCFRCGEKGHYANICQGQKRAPPPEGYPGEKRQRRDHH